MIVFLWFAMVTFIIIVGFVVLAVVFRHYWKESRQKKASYEVQDSVSGPS